MPLVSTVLHQELGRPPTVVDRLEQVVAHGALLVEAVRPQPEPESEPRREYRPEPPREYRTEVPSVSVPGARARLHRSDRMPNELWIAGAVMLLQALPFSDALSSVYGVPAWFGLVAVAATVLLIRVRRSWAWGTLIAVQGIAIPLVVFLPLLVRLG